MQMMAGNISEMYIKGKWFKVSALDVDGKTIAITGRWLKLAVVRSEEWLETVTTCSKPNLRIPRPV